MFHLLINGRPLCEHTACRAGQDDRRKVLGEPTCAQGVQAGAMSAAEAWKAAHPRHHVTIGLGPCPLDERGEGW